VRRSENKNLVTAQSKGIHNRLTTTVKSAGVMRRIKVCQGENFHGAPRLVRDIFFGEQDCRIAMDGV
jgi:hypothetical protein